MEPNARLRVHIDNAGALSEQFVLLDLLPDGSYEFTDAAGLTVPVSSDEALRRIFEAFNAKALEFCYRPEPLPTDQPPSPARSAWSHLRGM